MLGIGWRRANRLFRTAPADSRVMQPLCGCESLQSVQPMLGGKSLQPMQSLLGSQGL